MSMFSAGVIGIEVVLNDQQARLDADKLLSDLGSKTASVGVGLGSGQGLSSQSIASQSGLSGAGNSTAVNAALSQYATAIQTAITGFTSSATALNAAQAKAANALNAYADRINSNKGGGGWGFGGGGGFGGSSRSPRSPRSHGTAGYQPNWTWTGWVDNDHDLIPRQIGFTRDPRNPSREIIDAEFSPVVTGLIRTSSSQRSPLDTEIPRTRMWTPVGDNQGLGGGRSDATWNPNFPLATTSVGQTGPAGTAPGVTRMWVPFGSVGGGGLATTNSGQVGPGNTASGPGGRTWVPYGSPEWDGSRSIVRASAIVRAGPQGYDRGTYDAEFGSDYNSNTGLATTNSGQGGPNYPEPPDPQMADPYIPYEEPLAPRGGRGGLNAYRQNRSFIMTVGAAAFAFREVAAARDAVEESNRFDRAAMYGTQTQNIQAALDRTRSQDGGFGGLVRAMAASDIGHAVWSASLGKILGGYDTSDYDDPGNEVALEGKLRESKGWDVYNQERYKSKGILLDRTAIGLHGPFLELQQNAIDSQKLSDAKAEALKPYAGLIDPGSLSAAGQIGKNFDDQITNTKLQRDELIRQNSMDVKISAIAADAAAGSVSTVANPYLRREYAIQQAYYAKVAQFDKDNYPEDDPRRQDALTTELAEFKNVQIEDIGSVRSSMYATVAAQDLAKTAGRPFARMIGQRFEQYRDEIGKMDDAGYSQDDSRRRDALDRKNADIAGYAADSAFNAGLRDIGVASDTKATNLLSNHDPLGAQLQNLRGNLESEIAGLKDNPGTEKLKSDLTLQEQAKESLAKQNYQFETNQVQNQLSTTNKQLSILFSRPWDTIGANLAGNEGSLYGEASGLIKSGRSNLLPQLLQNAQLDAKVQQKQYLNSFEFMGNDPRFIGRGSGASSPDEVLKEIAAHLDALPGIIAKALADAKIVTVDQGQ